MEVNAFGKRKTAHQQQPGSGGDGPGHKFNGHLDLLFSWFETIENSDKCCGLSKV